jgi:hypothetical protein
MTTIGDLRVIRADQADDPQPWTFFVTFEPHHGTSVVHTCVGLLGLAAFLRRLGLSGSRLERALVALERRGRHEVRDVALSDDQIREL